MGSRTPARRPLTVVAAVTVAGLLAVPAVGQEDDPPVFDPLADGDAPSAADIADSIRSIEPVVNPLEVSEPRSLREEVEEERTTVTIASDVLFAFDSDELSPRAEATVRQLAAEVGDATGTVDVIGHTDSVGDDAYNQDLSERRAAAVAAVLAEELGDQVDLATAGRGSSEPVADESDEDPGAAARNRRVEIVFDR